MQPDLRSILRSFMASGRVKAGELLLPPVEALNLIDCLERAGEVVTGVEVWYLLGDSPVESNLFLPLHVSGGVEENATRARQFIGDEVPRFLASGKAPDIPSADLISVGFSSMFSVVDSLLE